MPLYIGLSMLITIFLDRQQEYSYRERMNALTESTKTLLPRAHERSYRERMNALTENARTLLPRAFYPLS